MKIWSILGPTLFLAYINDMCQSLPDGVGVGIYADDTTLYIALTARDSAEQNCAKLQLAVDMLHEWGQRWCVSFEPSKSQALTVSRTTGGWPIPPVSFGGTSVLEFSAIKLLGVTFDKKLNFAQHIRTIAMNTRRRLHFFRRAARVLDCSGKASVYKGFVRPLMEYCPTVWMGATATHLSTLDSIQQRASKIIGPAARLPSLSSRREVKALSYLYKLHCPETHAALKTMRPPRLVLDDSRSQTRSRRAIRAHPCPLQYTLPTKSLDNAVRSFPYSTIHAWNSLPPEFFPSDERNFKREGLKQFVRQVHSILHN